MSRESILALQNLPHASEWCTNYAAWHGDTAPARTSTPLPTKPKPPPQNAKTPNEPLPAAYVPLDVTFRHDRCSVCYTVEEYDDNQLLQCDKCRVMVRMGTSGRRVNRRSLVLPQTRMSMGFLKDGEAASRKKWCPEA